jgi:hypothetical protein
MGVCFGVLSVFVSFPLRLPMEVGFFPLESVSVGLFFFDILLLSFGYMVFIFLNHLHVIHVTVNVQIGRKPFTAVWAPGLNHVVNNKNARATSTTMMGAAVLSSIIPVALANSVITTPIQTKTRRQFRNGLGIIIVAPFFWGWG